jgi:hypothetical protein
MSKAGVVGDDPLVEMIMAGQAVPSGLGVTTDITKAAEWAKQPLGKKAILRSAQSQRVAGRAANR